jgi:hypothetical protein
LPGAAPLGGGVLLVAVFAEALVFTAFLGRVFIDQ